MTPSQWIEEMGAGWNLGNTYEYYLIKTPENEKWRYWCAKGAWTYSVMHNDEGLKDGNISPLSRGAATEVTISFVVPTDGIVSVIIRHPIIETGVSNMKFTITTMKIDDTVVIPTIDEITFPAFSNKESVLANIDLSTLTSETIAGKELSLTLLIDRDSLPQYPTNDENVLSAIRTYYNTASRAAGGTPAVTEAQAKAVAAAGFKSVRIPITWLSHFDVVDDNGNVRVDAEFLDHLAEIIGYFHKYNLSVVINMHHDDQVWLKTGLYITDPACSVRYKSIWAQIADYFKDYGDWLAFGSNNETRNDKGVWEGGSVTKQDQYGIIKIQQDFYDVVRNSGGNNATRICMYPTYAAKTQYLNVTYENPDDPTDTDRWHLPNNDPYGIAEIHPYTADIGQAQEFNKNARYRAIDRGIPVIYGEFGVNASQMHEQSNCVSQAYTIAYATYYGIGTYIWDDYGGMQILKRNRCKMDNSENFDYLWNGSEWNFVQALTASADLKTSEILLNNRRQSCYVGDEVSIFLDSKFPVNISNEGSGEVQLNGNTFVAGFNDIDDLLAISYMGEYNLIDVTVDMPEHWNETTYDDTNPGWTHTWYSPYNPFGTGTMYNSRCISIVIDTPVPCTEISIHNTTVSNKGFLVLEYGSNGHLLKNYTEQVTIYNDSEPYLLPPECKKVVLQLAHTRDIEIQSGTWAKTKARDFSQTEEKDITDSYVDSITDYENFYTSLYRTVNVSGGMEYELNLGSVNCDVYIREFNGTKLEAEYWVKNGDKFTTNLFTKSMRIEIEVPNSNIDKVIKAMNDGALRPTLSYTDYATHVPEYDEEFTPIPTEMKHGLVTVGGKLIKCDGKFIKI